MLASNPASRVNHISPRRGKTLRASVLGKCSSYKDRPWLGNAVIRTLRLLMNFGLFELGLPGLTSNPAEKLTLYKPPPRDQIWDQPRIDAFLDVASPRVRLGFALMLYTVQRPDDMLGLERPNMFVRDGRDWISLCQAKTNTLIDVPCHQRLREELAVHEAATVTPTRQDPSGSQRILSNEQGKPWSYRRFAQALDLTRKSANWAIARRSIRAMGGLPRFPIHRAKAKHAIRAQLLNDLQRRDLRRIGVVQLALVGATIPQIAALTGWGIDHTQRIVDTYLPRRGEVALGGIEKWENGKGNLVDMRRRKA